MQDTQVGGQQGGGFFSNKRNVLMAAGVLGGAVGLIFFLTRPKGTPSDQQTSAHETGSTLDGEGIQVMNLANQLSALRGETGVSFAELTRMSKAQGEATSGIADALSKLGVTVNATNFTVGWLDFAREYAARQQQFAAAIAGTSDPKQRATLQKQYEDYTASMVAAGTARGYFKPGSTGAAGAGGDTGGGGTDIKMNQAKTGAGGMDWGGWVPLPSYDAGMGDGGEALSLMAAAPVRYIGDLGSW